MTRCPSAQRGFTLIEVVVALAVFALCISAVYEVFQSSLRRMHQSDRRALALLHAESLLSELRVRPGPWSEHAGGHLADGFSWTVSVEPYVGANALPSEPAPASDPWKNVLVIVDVHEGASPGAILHSVELEPLQP